MRSSSSVEAEGKTGQADQLHFINRVSWSFERILMLEGFRIHVPAGFEKHWHCIAQWSGEEDENNLGREVFWHKKMPFKCLSFCSNLTCLLIFVGRVKCLVKLWSFLESLTTLVVLDSSVYRCHRWLMFIWTNKFITIRCDQMTTSGQWCSNFKRHILVCSITIVPIIS